MLIELTASAAGLYRGWEIADRAAASVAMIGDSVHDMEAARVAGMLRVAVLTGPATAEDLAPYADLVLPDIGHLAQRLA